MPKSRKKFLKSACDLTTDVNVPRRFNEEISLLEKCFVRIFQSSWLLRIVGWLRINVSGLHIVPDP